jgi:hypothetical protein
MIIFIPQGEQLEKYENGMRIICSNACDDNMEIIGKHGTIINDKYKRPLILFDQDINGHNGYQNGSGNEARCWLVDSKYLILMPQQANKKKEDKTNQKEETEMAKTRKLYELLVFDPKQQKVIFKEIIPADDEKEVLIEADIKSVMTKESISKLRDIDIIITEKGIVRSDITEVPVKLIMQAGKATLVKEEKE